MERRRRRRRHALIGLAIFLILLVSAIVWGLHQNAVRISHVAVFGADESLSTYATDAMQGSYLWIIPRNSTFFPPEATIREKILAEHPEIAALSVFTSGLTGLTIKIDDRVAIARWCGSTGSPQVASAGEYCYVFDANGLIFAAAASSTPTINTFKLYAPLQGNTLEPLRATIASPELLPTTFDFARQLHSFGPAVSAIVIHDGEVDMYLASGTRVTYVLGDGQRAYTALVSARSNINLTDGSFEYIDLRFDGKVYTKRR